MSYFRVTGQLAEVILIGTASPAGRKVCREAVPPRAARRHLPAGRM